MYELRFHRVQYLGRCSDEPGGGLFNLIATLDVAARATRAAIRNPPTRRCSVDRLLEHAVRSHHKRIQLGLRRSLVQLQGRGSGGTAGRGESKMGGASTRGCMGCIRFNTFFACSYGMPWLNMRESMPGGKVSHNADGDHPPRLKGPISNYGARY